MTQDAPSVDHRVREAVADVLGLPPASLAAGDNLISRGLDSIRTMALVGRWRAAGAEVDFAALARRPTLAAWSKLLSGQLTAASGDRCTTGRPAPRATAAEDDGPFPLTPVQQAYWIGRQDGRPLGGNGCHAYVEFDGHGVDPGRLEAAVRELIVHHDMLRAVFLDDGTQRVQPDSPWPGLTVLDLGDQVPERVEEELRRVRETLSHRRFDAAAGPLFDVRLSRLPGGATRIHLDIDLLIADVLSVQILLTDLARAYNDPGTVADRQRDYSFRRYLTDLDADRAARRDKDRAYWRARIEDLPGGPQLPLAADPADVEGGRFTRRVHRLGPVAWRAFADHARAHGVTPAVGLAAAYAAVLGAWSTRQRFVLNLPLFDRRPLHPDADRLVADFTNLVLVEVDTSDRAPFATLAERVQNRLGEDVAHAGYSAVEVLRDLARARPDEPATAPVVFACNLGGPFGGEFVGEEFRTTLGRFGWMLSQTPQVWLDHQVYEDDGGLLLAWDAVDELFPDGVLDAMFEVYGTLVRRLAEDVGAWDGPVPSLVPGRQLEVHRRVNATAAPESGRLLHQAAVEAALRDPGREALRWEEGTTLRSMSHGELLRRATAVADALRADGCAPGRPVAVVMDKGWEQIAAVLGVLLAGGAYLPVDTNQPPARRATVFEDATVRHVLTQSWLLSAEWPPGVRTVAVDTLEPAAHQGPPPQPPTGPEDLAYVIYTSGSTGRPKGVMISHRAAVNTVEDINRRYEVGSGDRALALAALGFDLSVYDIFGVLGAGGTLVLPAAARRGDPSHWAELIRRHEITLWNSVPAQLQMLLHYLDGDPSLRLPSPRLALLSGDWIPVTLPDAVRARVPGLRLIGLGGATEAAIWSIHHPIGQVPPHWRSIPYGTPLANQTFHVLDAAMRPRPDLVPGELWIGGTGLALGYLGDVERTAERFVRHPDTGERLYRTGDLGRRLPDGSIEFLGREDFQVKVRGHRIELAEIETALLAHPLVGGAVATVVGKRAADRRIAAVVTGTPAEPGARAAATVAELERAGAAAGRRVVPPGRRSELDRSGRLLSRAALTAMAAALHRLGAFTPGAAPPTAEEVLRRTGTVPRHQRVVRRWLTALEAAGMVTRDPGTGRLLDPAPACGEALDRAWADIDEHERHGGGLWPAPVLALFRTSMERLPELLRGDLDQVRLLFPDGQLETAQAAFADNLIVRYLNRAAAAVAARLAAGTPPHRPLRVLEIGAGVGATTQELVPALAAAEPDYLFTDVSRFFLNAAQARFGDRPWMRYGLFDINEDHRAQGYRPQSFDLIVAANVLHNARHIGHTLDRLRELLAPGGWLVFTELTADRHELMTSMEFLVRLDQGQAHHDEGDFEDLRRGLDQTFLDLAQWRELLTAAGAQAVFALPGDGDDALSGLGQHLIAATFKGDRTEVVTADVLDHLAERLPDYMIPAHLEAVDAIPLSANGKVDRKTVRSWLSGSGEAARRTGEAPRDDLERRLAAQWEAVLGDGPVARDGDFFALGGDSLLAAQLVGRLRRELPEARTVLFDALLRDLLRHPTVAGIATALRGGGEGR
ncbi:amino acid adenylation domain-containing protein [Streptomyces sp. OE57]|uniref:non-ribosomal peptide synthetase n=1 Tax=Streptomyces lacaronensis TaxID=3379885 RepID=UPI0039B74E14